jgi:hypothetical protein
VHHQAKIDALWDENRPDLFLKHNTGYTGSPPLYGPRFAMNTSIETNLFENVALVPSSLPSGLPYKLSSAVCFLKKNIYIYCRNRVLKEIAVNTSESKTEPY